MSDEQLPYYGMGLSVEQQQKLPNDMLLRWYRETNYGTVKPSDELVQALWKAAGKE